MGAYLRAHFFSSLNRYTVKREWNKCSINFSTLHSHAKVLTHYHDKVLTCYHAKALTHYHAKALTHYHTTSLTH